MTDSEIKKENMQISAENDSKPAPSTVKLPAFTPTDAEYWFALVENIFRRVGIKDNATKYLYAVAELPSLDSLSPSIRKFVIDNVDTTEETYTKFKEVVIKHYAISEADRAKRILALSESSGLNPKDLYNQMTTLALKDSEFLLKQLYLRALPEDLSKMIKGTQHLPFHELAAEAEKHWDGDAAASVMKATEKAKADKPRTAGQQRRNTEYIKEGKRVCYYHHRYGSKAYRCEPHVPCSMAPGNGKAGHQSKE